MITFLLSLPLWLLAIVLNVWLIGFSLAGLWAVRRWILPRMRINDEGALFFSAAVMQSAMVLYSLVAALTAVSVWAKHGQVSSVVSDEATAIAILWRDLGAYPEPPRDAMQSVLRDYTEQIIERAWPKQRQGEIPREGVEYMDRLQQHLFAFEPATKGQEILQGETLRAFDRMHEARRLRLDSLGTGLPTVMWFVILPGAMGCLILAMLVHVEDGGFQALLVAGLAGFVAMVLFVIVSLDQPFRGPMAVPADSYALIHEQLMKR